MAPRSPPHPHPLPTLLPTAGPPGPRSPVAQQPLPSALAALDVRERDSSSHSQSSGFFHLLRIWKQMPGEERIVN